MISPPSLLLWATIATYFAAAMISVIVAAAMRFHQKRSPVLPTILALLGLLSGLFAIRYAQLTVPGFPGWPIPSSAGRPYFFLISVAFLLIPLAAYLASSRDLRLHRQHIEESDAKARIAALSTAELQSQLAKLRKKNAEQHQLFQEWRYLIISNVGHELRTPVTFILGFIEMIIEGTFGQVAGTPLHGPLREVHTSTRRIDLIIERMSATWRVPHMLETDIAIICQQVIDSSDVWINTRRKPADVTITTDIPASLPVVGDTDMLRVAMLDLVNNAIKFGATMVRITVSQADDHATVQVQDNGIGIPLKYHRRVFEPLFQIEMDSTRPFEGAGMGLAAVEDIAHKHGGHVYAQNVPGQSGVLFTFTIPIQQGGR